jgi:hypothetical protein
MTQIASLSCPTFSLLIKTESVDIRAKVIPPTIPSMAGSRSARAQLVSTVRRGQVFSLEDFCFGVAVHSRHRN